MFWRGCRLSGVDDSTPSQRKKATSSVSLCLQTGGTITTDTICLISCTERGVNLIQLCPYTCTMTTYPLGHILSLFSHNPLNLSLKMVLSQFQLLKQSKCLYTIYYPLYDCRVCLKYTRLMLFSMETQNHHRHEHCDISSRNS